MAASCQPPPLQIFRDPVTSFDRPEMAQMRAAPPAMGAPLRPLVNNSSNTAVVFEPPALSPVKPSPRKPEQQSSSPPKSAPLPDPVQAISIPPPNTSSFTDSPKKKATAKPRAQQPLFTTFQCGLSTTDKENVPTAIGASAPSTTGSRPSSKHAAPADFAQSRDRAPKRPRVEEPPETDVPVPEPADMPPVEDDGQKPPYSYATLIGMALLRAPNRRLTLAQIYKWISDTFVHYRTVETGWQNSIRHNLSLNKAFEKQMRPKNDPGKGNYWLIKPGWEGMFVKEKQGRRPLAPNSVAPSALMKPGVDDLPPLEQASSSQPAAAARSSLAKSPPPPCSSQPKAATAAKSTGSELAKNSSKGKKVEARPRSMPTTTLAPLPPHNELSSDATIIASDNVSAAGNMPASDSALHDLEPTDDVSPDLRLPPPPASRGVNCSPGRLMRSSPPPIFSSSPVASRRRPHRFSFGMTSTETRTPPSARLFALPPRNSMSAKRPFGLLKDSGYASTLDSSVLRSKQTGPILLSDADRDVDRPRTSSGRAEDELARVRRTMQDSPSQRLSGTKRKRSLSQSWPTPSLVSSPQHDDKLEESDSLLETMRAGHFRVPKLPTPQVSSSMSPGTMLRNHRERVRSLVGSPLRRYEMLTAQQPLETVPRSPAFNLDSEYENLLYEDGAAEGATMAGSPIRRFGGGVAGGGRRLLEPFGIRSPKPLFGLGLAEEERGNDYESRVSRILKRPHTNGHSWDPTALREITRSSPLHLSPTRPPPMKRARIGGKADDGGSSSGRLTFVDITGKNAAGNSPAGKHALLRGSADAANDEFGGLINANFFDDSNFETVIGDEENIRPGIHGSPLKLAAGYR